MASNPLTDQILANPGLTRVADTQGYWFQGLPWALHYWNMLSPEQQELYQRAYQAYTGALANQQSAPDQQLPGGRGPAFDNPYWAEKYPGF